MIAGILLAAGAGSRFGGGKLLHEVAGVALGARSARNLIAAGLPVTAVVRPGSAELTQLLSAQGCAVTECTNAADGMGVSLAHVIAHTRDASGWVVALADMPSISHNTLRAVADAVAGGALIAAPVYRGERGHPVGFSGKLLGELLQLKGDEGARAVVKRHYADITWLDVDDAGVLFDIDHREDVPSRL